MNQWEIQHQLKTKIKQNHMFKIRLKFPKIKPVPKTKPANQIQISASIGTEIAFPWTNHGTMNRYLPLTTQKLEQWML